MEISQDDRLLISEQTRDTGDLDWKSKFEDYLRELKKEVGEQPFLCLAIAFLSGLISHTFPARFLFRVLAKLVSWSVGPAILLLGIFKLSELLTKLKRNESTVLQHP
jgi:hypothetical protein